MTNKLNALKKLKLEARIGDGEELWRKVDKFHLNTLCKEERVSDEWRDAILVPIPTKGDLTTSGESVC